MKRHIVIIGAGSTGLSIALELARVQSCDVTLVEKGFVGSGQTGQCCGFVRMFYNVPQMAFSAQWSYEKIRALCYSSGISYVKTGLPVIDDMQSSQTIRSNVEMLCSLGIEARSMGPDKIVDIHPGIEAENICCAYDPNAGHVNPQLIINVLEQQCVFAGVTIHEQTCVHSIQRVGGGFRISTNVGELVCDDIINATGGSAEAINAMLGISLPVIPMRVYNAFYRFPKHLHRPLVGIADFVNRFYLIPHEDFVDVSTMALNQQLSQDTINGPTTIPQDIPLEYLTRVNHRFSGALKSAQLGGFASHIDLTPDSYPIISRIDQAPGYFCAVGFGGTGFKHFPMVGLLMKELVLKIPHTFPNLITFFRYDRFEKSDSIRRVSDGYFVD